MSKINHHKLRFTEQTLFISVIIDIAIMSYEKHYLMLVKHLLINIMLMVLLVF